MKAGKLVSIISAVVVSATLSSFSISECMAAEINIRDTYVEGDLYIYVVNSGFVPYDSEIYLDNVYVGGNLGIYQFTDNGSFVPVSREMPDFRGRSPMIY